MKEQIINRLSIVNREGIKELIAFLESSDYFTAPCSSKYHCSYRGGLAEHSWKVYKLFKAKNKYFNLGLSPDTIAICSLLHDVCKIFFYKQIEANWEKQEKEHYECDDRFPLGHGEKSVIVIQRFIKLTDEECCIIRWHMTAFGDNLNNQYHNSAYYKSLEMYPAGLALFTADYESTIFLEKKNAIQ